MTHDIKIERPYFEAVRDERKRFEIRYNDRGYNAGDYIILTPYENGVRIDYYEPINAVITYVTNYQQKEGYVVFGFDLFI